MRPAANGGCERSHRVINSLLAKVISERQTDWTQYLPYVTFCYNSCVNRATNYSPFFLMFLREPVYNIDIVLENPSVERSQSNPEAVAKINGEWTHALRV
jgi:hypothetical protein